MAPCPRHLLWRSEPLEKDPMWPTFYCGIQFSPNSLQQKWGGYLAVANMFPLVTFLILNGLFGHKFPTMPKLTISLVLLMVSFLFTSIMVQVSYNCINSTIHTIFQVNTDDWQTTFFNLTLVSAAFVSINSANLQVCKIICILFITRAWRLFPGLHLDYYPMTLKPKHVYDVGVCHTLIWVMSWPYA